MLRWIASLGMAIEITDCVRRSVILANARLRASRKHATVLKIDHVEAVRKAAHAAADWSLLDLTMLSRYPGLQGDAELTACRATGKDLSAIEAAFAAMTAAVPDAFSTCCKAGLACHRSVDAASHNVVLRGMTA